MSNLGNLCISMVCYYYNEYSVQIHHKQTAFIQMPVLSQMNGCREEEWPRSTCMGFPRHAFIQYTCIYRLSHAKISMRDITVDDGVICIL